jgi:hypothetical protein
MLSARKIAVPLQTAHDYRRELEYLYARKSALDSLIASLEEYQRASTDPPSEGQLKTA